MAVLFMQVSPAMESSATWRTSRIEDVKTRGSQVMKILGPSKRLSLARGTK